MSGRGRILFLYIVSRDGSCLKTRKKTMANPDSYSSHTPLVGVYVALASLACLGLMVHDIGAAFLMKRRWIPCKYFTLNSITIQMLGIAAKVSLDLRTDMPSMKDQISKVTGTVFICVSMLFFLPSLGVTQKSECFTNLISLSIFVFTVVAKVSYQISTGVIDDFIVYLHVIILCFMIFLLISLWVAAWDIHHQNRISIDKNKAILSKDNGSMFQRLKRSCFSAYLSNPQLLTSVSPTNGVNYLMMCFLVGSLIPALQTLFFSQSSGGESEYKWSITIILSVQFIACLVGPMAIAFRMVTVNFRHVQYVPTYVDHEFENMIQKNPILGNVNIRDKYSKMFLNIYVKALIWVQSIFISAQSCFLGDRPATGWLERKGKEYLQKKVDAGRQKSTTNLHQLLADIAPSHQWNAMELRDEAPPNQRLKVNSLSLVLLVRIAQVSLRNDLWRPMVTAFEEVKKILFYIDKQKKKKTLKNDQRLFLAKAVWAGDDFQVLLPKMSFQEGYQSDLDRAVYIISRLSHVLPSDSVQKELELVSDFINRKTYQSVDDLSMSIQQMFVDMLHILLSKLPIAIIKHLKDCPADEYQKNAAKAVEFLSQVKEVEAQIQWSFPVGSNISILITEEDISGVDPNNIV